MRKRTAESMLGFRPDHAVATATDQVAALRSEPLESNLLLIGSWKNRGARDDRQSDESHEEYALHHAGGGFAFGVFTRASKYARRTDSSTNPLANWRMRQRGVEVTDV